MQVPGVPTLYNLSPEPPFWTEPSLDLIDTCQARKTGADPHPWQWLSSILADTLQLCHQENV